MTRKESELMIMTYALRHNIDELPIEGLIGMIYCHLPHREFRSMYRFLKSFNYPTYKEYYYCEECHIMLYFESERTILANRA